MLALYRTMCATNARYERACGDAYVGRIAPAVRDAAKRGAEAACRAYYEAYALQGSDYVHPSLAEVAS